MTTNSIQKQITIFFSHKPKVVNAVKCPISVGIVPVSDSKSVFDYDGGVRIMDHE